MDLKLPEFDKAWEYENNFYLSAKPARLSKVLAHYELFKATMDLPGHIVECGVFKGASLLRFAMMRELFLNAPAKRIVGFDAFGAFPETNEFEGDKLYREQFIEDSGESGISVEQLREVLEHKGVGANVDLVRGDVCQTVPQYIAQHPEIRVSLLNLDTDVYEPAVTVFEHFWPRIVKGGILILDDYNVFPGETQAAEDFFKDKGITIRKFPFAVTPCYIVKERF